MASNTESASQDMQENKDTERTQEFTASPNVSKRKKDLDNRNEGNSNNGILEDWQQTEYEIKILLTVDNLTAAQVTDVDITLSDTDANVKFPDGKVWTVNFHKNVQADSCKVFLKNNQLTICIKKKEPRIWTSLSGSNFSQREKQSLSNKETTDNDHEKVTENTPSSPNEEKGSKETKGKETVKDDSEHGIHYLQHTKHDWIEKETTFVVHVYVKDTNKEAVKVQFEVQTLTVYFQTGDQKFLSLHPGTTKDTTFCWKVQLKHDIVPAMSKYRLTSSMIEVTLAKHKQVRWNTLELPQRKENTTASTSKSDSWISTGKQCKTTAQNTENVPLRSEVAYDELSDVTVKKSDLDNRSADVCHGATGVSQPLKDFNSQKPTCKVSPMNKNRELDQVVSPGFTGLDNLGNTCFMNSVLQALSNTREFRDFFLEGEFQVDINTENPLGSGGKLAVAFAVLLKVLWAAKHYSYAPSKLKNLVAMKASQFTGFAQHDAQEFMAFLLDGLHEDLNRVKKKPYTETVDSDGRPDEVVAKEAWDVYKKRNDSFIVNLFQGQYKSKLVCPVCEKVSITFDPFLYLSVPLPKKKRMLPVIFMWKDPHKKPVQLILRLSKDCTTEMVKEAAAKKTGTKPKNLRVIEAYKGKIYKFYGRGSDWASVLATDIIIIGEVLSEEMAGEPVYELYIVQRTVLPNVAPTRCASCKRICSENAKLKRCTKCFKVGYCDHKCQRDHWNLHKNNCKHTPEPVGCPFILSIGESRATFSRLCSLMEAYARYSVDVFQPPVKHELPCKLSGQSSNSSSLSSSSSQSSGSMNSLDSQSSISSSCTITADQEQNLADDITQDCSSATGNAAQAGNGEMSASSSFEQLQNPMDVDNSVTNLPPCIVDSDIQLGEDSTQEDLGERNLPEYTSFKLPQSDYADMTREAELGLDCQGLGDDSDSRNKGAPTNPVLGIKSDDMDRPLPLFFIKPVNQEGAGIKGPDGERLEDKGDVPLDLSYRQFLSIDWKNNDKLSPYVLVQSKEMDTDEDPSLQNASFEENNITLQQCLELFTEPEVLSPDEAWYCPRCKEHREATKQMSIWKLPHTVIIQLKRFSFRNFIWRDKIDKMVEFPVRGLNLSPYFIGTRPKNEPPPVYDLYAVVNHYGGILGGHYTSFVRCADLVDNRKNEVDWRLCDDSRVTSVGNEKNVVTRGAYLLFYRRRDVFSPLPKTISFPEEEEYSKAESQDSDNAIKVDSSDQNNSSSGSSHCTPSADSFVPTQSKKMEYSCMDSDIKDINEKTPLLDNRFSSYTSSSHHTSDSEEERGQDGPPHINYSYRSPKVEDLGYTDMEAVD